MSQADPDLITDTPSWRSDENTTAASSETSQVAPQPKGKTDVSTIQATKGGWYQLKGVLEIREMIFKEYLRDLNDAILRGPGRGSYFITLDSSYLLSCLNVLDVCKGFVREFLPLLRKSVALVTTWSFCGTYAPLDEPRASAHRNTWKNVSLHLAALKRLFALSIHHGFRFLRYALEFHARDPRGYETARFLAALAKYMRARGATGRHDFDRTFKLYWIQWCDHEEYFDYECEKYFDYECERSEDDPVGFCMSYNGTGAISDFVEMSLESDVATLDFQDFDWKPIKVV